MNPFPNFKELVVLGVGLLLGVLASQAVLGVFAPDAYERFFVGGVDEQVAAQADREKMAEFDAAYVRVAQAIQDEADLPGEGYDDAARADLTRTQQAIAADMETLGQTMVTKEFDLAKAKADHQVKLGGYFSALIVAIAAAMILEATLMPAPRKTLPTSNHGANPATYQRGRRRVEEGEDEPRVRVPAVMVQLRLVRYGLMAGWILLATAHPTLLYELPWLMLGTLAAVVMVAGFVPMLASDKKS